MGAHRGLGDRQPKAELTPLARAVARRLHVAAVKPDNSLDHGQAEPKPTAAPIQLLPSLDERFEYVGHDGPFEPDSRVPNGDPTPIRPPIALEPDFNRAAAIGELTGVVQQVSQHLRQPS